MLSKIIEILTEFIKLVFDYAFFPMVLAIILVPLVKVIGLKLGIYAQENSRTVHHGKIVRLGGVAIFLSFMIFMAYYLKTDTTINAILIGGSIVFIGGVLDDMFDLPPLIKLTFQSVGALIVIVIGDVSLGTINLPFDISFDMGFISKLITFIWIIGVSNAINLIDGLDGLSSGISAIVLMTIAFIATQMLSMSVAHICLILSGAVIGFWFYNFHPASIFMGDCGALFLGFMIACLSLLGFKTATFVTLGFPIIILFVPILDTFVAIVRRKLRGISFSVGDKEHLHHILMFKLKLGHKNAVISLYIVTALFAICAVLSYYNEVYGMALLFVLVIGFELFIEITEMVNAKYHPLIGLSRRLTGYPKKKNKGNKEDQES